jgi:hypothetical protein
MYNGRGLLLSAGIALLLLEPCVVSQHCSAVAGALCCQLALLSFCWSLVLSDMLSVAELFSLIRL